MTAEPTPRPKADLRATHGAYTARAGQFSMVTLAPLTYLMIDGHGDPNASAAYRDALQTIYPVAYGLKFLSRRELGRDYGVMPLEALWWADDMTHFTSARDKSTWHWTMLNLVPEWITDEHVDVVRDRVEAKGGAPALPLLRRAVLDEGLSVQTLHIGPYDAEAPTLERLHDEVIPAAGLRMTGHHHEIYLSDARRTALQRLRTILRQPVEPVPPTPK